VSRLQIISSLTLSCELIVLHLHRCMCLYTVHLKTLSMEPLLNRGPNMAARAHSSMLKLYGRCSEAKWIAWRQSRSDRWLRAYTWVARFNRLPFALSNSPANFQRLVDTVLKNLVVTECFVFIDDFIAQRVHGIHGLFWHRCHQLSCLLW